MDNTLWHSSWSIHARDQVEIVCFVFRTMSYIVIIPILLLVLLDVLSYLYFRTVHQPFGQARTVVYKQWPAFSRPSSTTTTPAAHSPKLPHSPSEPSSSSTSTSDHPRGFFFPALSARLRAKTQNMTTHDIDRPKPSATPSVARPELSSSSEESLQATTGGERKRGRKPDGRLPMSWSARNDSPSRARAESVGVEGPMGFDAGSPPTSPEERYRPLPNLSPIEQ